jgi:hypothetical protein
VAQQEAAPLAPDGPSETENGTAVPEEETGSGGAATSRTEEESTDILVPGSD